MSGLYRYKAQDDSSVLHGTVSIFCSLAARLEFSELELCGSSWRIPRAVYLPSISTLAPAVELDIFRSLRFHTRDSSQ